MTTIPFKREFDFEYGRCDTLSPLIRRVVASNPGPFTFTGTGVYIVGHGTVAMIDPGPLDAGHEAALDQALEGERVSHVLLTHHHLDHSPLAARMASRHGCKTYGRRPRRTPPAGGETRMEAGDDDSFAPDVELEDGDVLTGPGWTLEALHTPGHTSNHLCFALKEENTLFSGDHVMAWSTSVVSPPDGHMGDYISQLERIRARGFGRIWPTHGPAIDDPEAFLDAYIEHRRARERQILGQIEAGRTTIREMVSSMYADVDKRLHPAAAHSVLAHIIHLVEQGRIEVADGGTPDLGSTYTLTG
ncbi:MBL fold metallo-hydrolase [Marinicauda pacifica]|uniref:MBL fold metallo-hydrolase n=1 Tax=Marinicauda pacifica TaxID=1133559 RepID=A0A4S2HDQ9_9PROT|nr:MBL fold metallo-hydrolase [Marinicauda pacifica]TGY93898.1 MBL fold metallo-hydrolase [Marinicauda pacifica]GGE31261.1 MBL fold metallo-hydrolase [Marinicauda pacifica]